jgi:hypothetical protein
MTKRINPEMLSARCRWNQTWMLKTLNSPRSHLSVGECGAVWSREKHKSQGAIWSLTGCGGVWSGMGRGQPNVVEVWHRSGWMGEKQGTAMDPDLGE